VGKACAAEVGLHQLLDPDNQRAYEILRNPGLRAGHDAEFNRGDSSSAGEPSQRQAHQRAEEDSPVAPRAQQPRLDRATSCTARSSTLDRFGGRSRLSTSTSTSCRTGSRSFRAGGGGQPGQSTGSLFSFGAAPAPGSVPPTLSSACPEWPGRSPGGWSPLWWPGMFCGPAGRCWLPWLRCRPGRLSPHQAAAGPGSSTGGWPGPWRFRRSGRPRYGRCGRGAGCGRATCVRWNELARAATAPGHARRRSSGHACAPSGGGGRARDHVGQKDRADRRS
jgi:curved DNA-binding protein CbpA